MCRPVAALALCAALATVAWADPAVVLREAFDRDLSGWVVGRHLPADPNDPAGGPVASEASISAENVYAGEGALRLYLDGRQDDGALWVARPLVVPGGAADLTLRFRFYSPFGGSFNNLAYAVAYLGPRAPAAEEDFARVAPVAEVDGWQELTHTARAEVAAGDTVWATVGFSVVWETEQTYFVDDLVVEVSDPATAAAPATWGRLKARRPP